MNEIPDGELTDTELELVNRLSESQLEEIDNMLVSEASTLNRKVARIVGFTMMKLPNRVQGIPDVFYAKRVKKLVKEGRLIAEGNLDFMRYSEVRLLETERVI